MVEREARHPGIDRPLERLRATLSGLRDEIINYSLPRALPWAIRFRGVGR